MRFFNIGVGMVHGIHEGMHTLNSISCCNMDHVMSISIYEFNK